MEIINSRDINNIIRKTLSLIDSRIMTHCEIVAYSLYKMLQYEGKCTPAELIDYTMVGLLHDIGLFKSSNPENTFSFETINVWDHSVYGYLFLRYLSPLAENAEIILYHHLDYNKHSLIPFDNMRITEYLTFADKFDMYLRMREPGMDFAADFFSTKQDIVFSKEAQKLFFLANKKYNIIDNIRSGAYRNELNTVLSQAKFDETTKRGYLEMLIYTIDFRSEFTVLHTLGTTTFALELAKLMKLDKMDTYKLYYGALLHDLGKMAVPVEILEAPRRLSEIEMDIMRLHVTTTEQTLRGMVHPDVLDIASRHHERMDGSGYPHGLNSEQLTLPQRIVAVADVISALYQKRSYKEAMGEAEIREILQSEADSNKLAPEVVAVALKNFKTIAHGFELKKDKTMGTYLQIKEQYASIYAKFKQFDSPEA